MRNKLLFLPFFLLLVPGPSMARESIPRDTVGVKVYFRQNHASLDSLFRDNGSRLDSFSRRLSSFRGDTALQIRSVRVVSGASPEGSSEINRSLSERRSAAIRSYLEKRGSLEGVTRNFAASLFRNIKYFTLRKLYLCRKWMQKRLQKTTTTGITLPNFDFLA